MKDDVDVICQIGYVLMRWVSGHKNYIGFGETIEDALGRPSEIHERQMSVKDECVLRVVRFLQLAWHVLQSCSGLEHSLASTSHKATCPKDSKDWEVLRFFGTSLFYFIGR